jgi:hypothetical protein
MEFVSIVYRWWSGLASLAGTDECVRPNVGRAKVGQVFPEEFSAVQDFSSAHVEEVHGQHLIFVVISEDIGIVAVDGGYALLLL